MKNKGHIFLVFAFFALFASVSSVRAGEWVYVADELFPFAYSTDRGWVIVRGSEVGIQTLSTRHWWEMGATSPVEHFAPESILGRSIVTVSEAGVFSLSFRPDHKGTATIGGFSFPFTYFYAKTGPATAQFVMTAMLDTDEGVLIETGRASLIFTSATGGTYTNTSIAEWDGGRIEQNTSGIFQF